MKLLAIDGNSIMNRAFYGIKLLSNSKGQFTNALTGFMNIYLKEIKAIAGGAGSSLGTGGMATKIKAAEICKNGGIDLIIMNGRDPRHLYKVFENKPIGTLFTANGEV